MTFILAYSICVTVITCLLSIRLFNGPSEPLPAFARACGQGLFFLVIVGFCALAAHGLVTIAEAVR